MKKLKLMLAFSGFLAMQNGFAQTAAHLTLSDAYPKAGEKITVAYDPAGTPVDGKSDLDARVYFLDNKDYPVTDLDLKPAGKLLKGDFTVPATAKAFFVRISKDETIDDNNEKGYVYLVYKDKKPVQGAYASKAYVLYSGIGKEFAKINSDPNEIYSLYKKEFQIYPESKKEYQSNYAMLLASGKEPGFAPLLNQQLNLLIKSDDEKDLILASNLYRRLKKTAKADSLIAIIKSKYPDGEQAKFETSMAFYREKDPVKKEALYNNYIEQFPENAIEKKSMLDNFRLQLASAYLQVGKKDDFYRIKNTIKDKATLCGILNNMAWEWAKAGKNLDSAAVLSKESLNLSMQKINNPETMAFLSPASMKKSDQANYDMYSDTYAFILYKQGKYKEALAYQQPIYERNPYVEITEHYALILKALGEDQKAKTVIETAVKAGKSSEVMNTELRNIYTKAKGSDAGYDTYFASLKNTAAMAARTALAKEMINKPAPAFALKDFEGNTVSLASLKGKVVVVDFWATWCGPCKASFPGMQLAVTKYKDNPNVQFLFIDTWENGDDYLTGVKKFIADNHYTFNVLMDEKGSDNRQSKVVGSFGVDGIPTKFILDKNGNIRFIKVGFEGSAEGIKDEVSAMIEMATNPELATGGKVTMLK